MPKKLILPGHQEPEASTLETFSNWLETAKLVSLDDDEIETLLDSVNQFSAKLVRERPESDRQLIRRYEGALYTIQRMALRMAGSPGCSTYDLKSEIDKIIKGAKLNERRR